MSCVVRVPEALTERVRADLRRPHPFAFERVGFLHARVSRVDNSNWLVLPYAFYAVPDGQYIRDDLVGARIDGASIRTQMERALESGVTVVHVHLHEHRGRPRFSSTDREGHGPLLRALHNAESNVPHGAMVLSQDSAIAVFRTPGDDSLRLASKIAIVGRPLRLSGSGDELYA